MKKNIFLVVSLIFGSIAINAQNVGINLIGNAPDASAMLDVASNEKGFLVPRMSMSDRDNIVSPANGLIIYNTDCNLLNYYDCDTWRKVGDEFDFPNLLNSGSKDYIYGKTNVSQNETGVIYEIPTVSGNSVTYNWTVPAGATIVSGQNTDRIIVDYGTSGTGYVCVEVNNGCGALAKTCIHIEICSLPIISSISGINNPAQNQSGVTYSITPVAGANSYNWTVPADATITAGQGATSITVDFSPTAQNGDICVTATDDCGTSLPQCLTLTMGVCPGPDVPVASSATNVTATDFDANWSAASGALNYYLDVSDDVNFNNLIVNDFNVGNVTTYNVSGLTCETDYYYRVRAENVCGITINSNDITITADYCSPYTLCGGGSMTFNDVTNPMTGKIWMDRNLGASQVALSSTDANAYGDLFQWGRGADGHQCRNSLTTGTLSSSDSPGHGNFIIGSTDWRNPQNNNLWQGVNGINNPCLPGYRVPTEAELDDERQSWSANDSNGAFGSVLKLTLAGYRDNISGTITGLNSNGYYRSSTVNGANIERLYITSSSADISDRNRAIGSSIRCIKN